MICLKKHFEVTMYNCCCCCVLRRIELRILNLTIFWPKCILSSNFIEIHAYGYQEVFLMSYSDRKCP